MTWLTSIRDFSPVDKEFEFFDSEQDFMQNAGRTPRSNCVLDSSKALDAGLKLTEIKTILRQCCENWVSEDAQVTTAG